MSEASTPRQPSGVGATGGLPGANSDPRASLVDEDELASTVGRGDVTDGLEAADAAAGAPDDGPRAAPPADPEQVLGEDGPDGATGADGQVAGPEDGASDNAAANAAPEVADDVLGRDARA